MFTPTLLPRQRAMSPHRYPIPSAFFWTQMSPRSGCKLCSTESATRIRAPLRRWQLLRHLWDQSGKGNGRKSKQRVSFFPPLSSVFPLRSLFGLKLLCRADGDRGRRAIQRKSGGKEPDCFNLSACGAPLFIKLFGRVIQTQALVFCAPPLFSHENQFPWRPSLIPFLASTMATCARPDRLRAGMMRLSALIPGHSGNGGPCHFVVPCAGLNRKRFAIIISCSAEAQPHYTPTRLLIRTDNQRD